MGLEFRPGDATDILPHHLVENEVTDSTRLCRSQRGIVVGTMVDGDLNDPDHPPLPQLALDELLIANFVQRARHQMRGILDDLAEVKCLSCGYYEQYLKVTGRQDGPPELVRDQVYPDRRLVIDPEADWDSLTE